jgi:hypothetical protein
MAERRQSLRRVDLDRLRVAACLSTFFYHAIQVFDLNPYYHLKSLTPSPALDVAARLLHAVRMPLFFLIAGMVGYLALARSTNREIMLQRAWRLLPPFLIGIVLLTPVIKYVELLDGRNISWQGITAVSGPPHPLELLRRYFSQLRWFSWSHMWFPLYLFLLAGLLMPAMRWLAKVEGDTRALALALLLPPAVLIAVEIVLRPLFPWHIPNLFWDWASVSVYATCMLAGAAFMRWPRLEELLQRWIVVSLALAALGIVLYLGVETWPGRNIGRALWLWGFVCVVIGARPMIERGNIPGERYLNEGVLPIYVLHHVPLILIAYAVKDLPWPIWQRFVVIVGGAVAVTFLVYHLLVRPFDWVRVAFGMTARERMREAKAVG